MTNRRYMVQGVGVLFFLFVLHIIFAKLSIYWIYPWTDNFVHMIAGFGVALFFISHIDRYMLIKWNFHGFIRRFGMVLFVAVVAIAWEYVERRFGLSKPFGQSLDDAQMDVWATIIGSFFGYLYVYARKK